MNYYQHHIGDFIRDTARLTDSQCMAYLRLIWIYYETESAIENDVDAIAFKIGANARDVHQILKHFFFLHDDGFWHQSRCDKEILTFRDKSEKAKKSADARWSNANAMRPHNERSANEPISNANQEPVTSNQEPKEKTKNKSAVAAPKYSDDDFIFAEGMAKAVIKVAPLTKPPDLGRWADQIRLMREVDNLTHSQIAEVFRFANKDDFWKVNILSPQTLRKQFAKLDAKMRNPTNEKRNGTSGDRWAIDHDDTSWLTGCADGSGDGFAGEHDIPAFADDLHRLEAGIGG